MDGLTPYIDIAGELDCAGLVWLPEIGDEVAARSNLHAVSILVDPQGMPVTELRQTFLWLPTIEQLVNQFEARQAIIFHAGLEMGSGAFVYKTVVQAQFGNVEATGESLRISMGAALRYLLQRVQPDRVH